MAHNKGWRNNPTDPSGRRHGLSAKGIKNAPSQRTALHKSMQIPYLGGSKANEQAILTWNRLSPQERGKILMLPAVKSKRTAHAKFNAAINHLKAVQSTRYRIFVKPEGERSFQKTPITFGSKQAAETFANVETAAGMGEIYEVKPEKGHAIPKNIMVLPVGDKLEVTNVKTGRTITISKKGDYDKDGVMNYLDCDPTDPNQQGFFDDLKMQVQNFQQKFKNFKEQRTAKKKVEQEQELASLRQRLEDKEESLERQKETTLLKLKSKNAEQRAAAEIKDREREIDKLQAQLEEGTLKQRLKLAAKSGLKRAGILAAKGIKRAVQEARFEPLPQKKLQAVTLTEEEKEQTSKATLKKLQAAERRKAEAEAKLRTQKLNEQAKQIESQLKRQPRKKKTKKKSLFSL